MELDNNYLGNRDKIFKKVLKKVLKKGKLKKEVIKILLSEDNLKLYGHAFTTEHIDKIYNYQFYEQLGDITANKFLVWYFYRRYPYLRMKEGVPIVARLRIKYGAKQTFYKIAEQLGFWEFISAPICIRNANKKPLLEDVFEAFIGVTEYILDEKYMNGLGYSIVYNILKDIFDNIKISLKYEDLFDNKTRLKELFDVNNDIGILIYEHEKYMINEYNFFKSKIYRIINPKFNEQGKKKYIQGTGTKIFISEGSANLKADADQNSAKEAIIQLNKEGFYNNIPKIFERFDEIKSISQNNNQLILKDLFNFAKSYNYIGIERCIINNINPLKTINNLNFFDILFININNNDFNSLIKILSLFKNKLKYIEINSNIFFKNIYYIKKLQEINIIISPKTEFKSIPII